MRRPEQALQQTVAQYLDRCLEPHVFWTAIPAGGGGKLRGAILKGMGYKAGTPDVLLIHRSCAYWIELKAGNGRVSPAQKEVGGHLFIAGCPVAVCRSLDSVIGTLAAWHIPTRGRLAA